MATSQIQPSNTPKPVKAKGLRSPSYPGINLETAIKRAEGFYKKERRNAAPFSVAVGHWGFGAKSSGGLVTVAAMRSFGLLKRFERSPGGRPVQLSDLALQILLDERPDSSERAAAIKKAALSPKLHASLWQKYRTAEEVSDANLKHDLVWRLKFNENTVDEVIKEYKDTIAYAKLAASDTLSLSPEDKQGTDEEEEEAEVPEVQQDQPPTKQPPLETGRTQTGIKGGTPGTPAQRAPLLTHTMIVSIPRDFKVEIGVRGDELKREDLDKIKKQFNRWIEGLEEAFE
jgi:hypothetical protein